MFPTTMKTLSVGPKWKSLRLISNLKATEEEVIPKGEREDEPEVEIDSFVFNTAARKVSLNDDGCAFPQD